MTALIAALDVRLQTLLIVAGVLVAAIAYWILSLSRVRGAVLVTSAVLYAVAVAGASVRTSDFLGGRSSHIGRMVSDGIQAFADQAETLKALGLVGIVLGVIDLVRQRGGIAISTTGGRTADGIALPPPLPGTAQACRRPGLWAAVAWCLMLITLLHVVPRNAALAVVLPGFRQNVVVNNWRFDGYHADRAVMTDYGAARRSVAYSVVVALATAMSYVVATGIACLLISADFGSDWKRVAGLVRPRPAHLLATVLAAIGLGIVVIGGEAVLQFVQGSRSFGADPISEWVACTSRSGYRRQWSWPVILPLVVVLPATTGSTILLTVACCWRSTLCVTQECPFWPPLLSPSPSPSGRGPG